MSKQQNYSINWSHIESALEEGTVSGYKIAVIEMEKIFSQVLEEKGFWGNGIAKQFQRARYIFKNPEKIERANTMYNKIIHNSGFSISADDTKDIIKTLHEAVLELEKMYEGRKGASGFFGKINRKINIFYQGTIKKWFFIFAISCFVILFLSKTSIGMWITSGIVAFVGFITFKIIVPVGLIVLAVYVLILGVKYFRTR